MTLGSTQLLTDVSNRSISWDKRGRCVRLTALPPSCAVVTKSGNLNLLEPSGPVQACNGTALPFTRKLSVQLNTNANMSPSEGLSSSWCSASHVVWTQLMGHQHCPLRADLYSLWQLLHKIRAATTTKHTHTHTHRTFSPEKTSRSFQNVLFQTIYPRDRCDPGSYSNLRRAAVHFEN